jgi:hypothetical protein
LFPRGRLYASVGIFDFNVLSRYLVNIFRF